jgi:hypothetical protein
MSEGHPGGESPEPDELDGDTVVLYSLNTEARTPT